jgi:hypothetical protein
MREGEEVFISLLPAGVERERVIEKYKGFMGKASKKEFVELLRELVLQVRCNEILVRFAFASLSCP